MKCLAKIKKGNYNLRCYKDCSFLFCNQHWIIFFKSKTGKRIIGIGILAIFLLILKLAILNKNYEGVLAPFSCINNQFGFKLGIDGISESSTCPLNSFRPDSLPTLMLGCPGDSIDHPIKISFLCNKGKFTVSLNVYDLKSKKLVGTIENNHFSFKRSLISEFYSDSTALEIENLDGNVIFSIFRDSANFPHVRGYFRQNRCLFCVSDRFPNPVLLDTVSKSQLDELSQTIGPLYINE